MPLRWCLVSLFAALLQLGVSGLEPLRSLRLRPDGAAHAARHDRPVRFSFWPQAEGRRGAAMRRFKIWVQQGEQAPVAQKEVLSAKPILELAVLPPGRYRWFVQWWTADGEASEVAESGLLVEEVGSDAWQGVPWLGHNESNEFRAEFNFGALPSGAAVDLRIATLGFGYATINGADISADTLTYSGWTNTLKRVLFRTYEVSALLNASGGGELSVSLGCGYRCDPHGRFPRYQDEPNRPYDSTPKIFRLQLLVAGKVVFHSGSPGWQMRHGAVVQDSVYGGVHWDPAAITAWVAAPPLPSGSGPKGQMVPATFPGVQVTRADAAVSITNPAEGVHVVDFGSNVAGVCEISIPGPATVTLKHGEVMQYKGMPEQPNPDPRRVYFLNLRSAEQSDTVVAHGAVTKWSPRLTNHGFRYVEVHGYPGNLSNESIRRLRLNAALEDKAHLHFEDEVLQAIHEGSKGAQRSNLQLVPSDCPQRDERLGWMGDASLSAASMLGHFDYGSMAAAFVDTMVDELDEDGALPDIVPFQKQQRSRPGDLTWTAAFLEVLWELSIKGGDLAPARAHWQDVLAHVGNLVHQHTQAGSMRSTPERYGDWCQPPSPPGTGLKERPSAGFVASFSLVRSLGQAAAIGRRLGGAAAARAEGIAALAQNLTAEFHGTFYDAARGRYDTGTMVSYVLPLALGSVPDSEKSLVLQHLIDHIESHNGTWTGGIVNNRFLFDLLHDNGHSDLALRMLQRKEYPSYGYMYFNDLEPARECMWEIPDAPFQGPRMNSRNHHMYSSVGGYLMRLAGLTAGPGEEELSAVVLPPAAGPGGAAGARPLLGASSSIHTTHGLANFSWRWESSFSGYAAGAAAQGITSLHIRLAVPVGLRLLLHVPQRPGHAPLQLREAGSQRDAPGKGFAEEEAMVVLHGEHFTRWTLLAGSYELSTMADQAEVAKMAPAVVVL